MLKVLVVALAVGLMVGPLASCEASQTTELPVGAVSMVPFQAVDNLILVPLTINASKPALFLLDTVVPASVIDVSLAKELGLKVEANANQGDGSGPSGTVGPVEVRLSGAALGPLRFVVSPLDGVAAQLGRPIGGIIGSDLFDKFVVEIDYTTQTIRLHDVAGYQYDGSANPPAPVRLPMTIVDHAPCVPAALVQTGGDSVTGCLVIDTGANGSVTLNGGFARLNDLLQRPRLLLTAPQPKGSRVGDDARADAERVVGRLKELRFGTATLVQPIVSVGLGGKVAGTATTSVGSIGGDVLRRFTVVIDYADATVILKPNREASKPFDWDMSGMSLVTGDSGFDVVRVRLVIPDSPAAEVGILAGDALAAIDGVPTKTLGLGRIRRMFRTPGQEYRLLLQRAGAVREVTVKTRPLV